MELEKKKKTLTKQVIRGPIIRYHSVTMPLVDDDEEENIQASMGNGQDTSTNKENAKNKQSRNFIMFTDENTMRQIFPYTRPKPPDVTKKMCAITGLPAKYFDPITQRPYANLAAFKILREMHAAKQLPPIVP